MTNSPRKSLYILDASGYIYRSYFAIRNMTNARGESTNALFGFIRSLLKLFKDFQPHHLVAVFDGPRNIHRRSKIYQNYKAHRAETPPDLIYQIRWAQQVCALMNVPFLTIPEVEADDTIGTIAAWGAAHWDQVYICSSDKDLCQLVNRKISILNTFKENQILGPAEVEENYGVPPQQMIDFLAMTGDSSDNVPGIPGIGPKTAAAWLKQYGSLDYILEHPQELPPKKSEVVIQHSQQIKLSQELVTLHLDVEIPKEMGFFELKLPDSPALKEFYASMNFHSLIRELEGGTQKAAAPTSLTVSIPQTLIEDTDAFHTLMKLLKQQTHLCVQVKGSSERPLQAEWVGTAFCIPSTGAWYLPMNGLIERSLIEKELKDLFEKSKIKFFGHNIKYDIQLLASQGIFLKQIEFDTMLASYLLNSHQRQHSLEHLVLDLFGTVLPNIDLVLGKGKQTRPMAAIPASELAPYFCADVEAISRVRETLEQQLQQRKLTHLFEQLELPLVSVLAEIERNGIYLETMHLQEMSKEVLQQIHLLEKEIQELAGEAFNLNSPKQLSHILYEKLKIKPPKKTATGLSTDAETLAGLRAAHPIAGKLLEYRVLEKLRSTYIDNLPLEVDPKTNRIHCTLNQMITATGRLSCQNPNLQNIPIRAELGRKIREAFRPEKKGWSYLSGDYSQVELRLLAHLSEDPDLVYAFQSGEDIHVYTASRIFNISPTEVTKEQRHSAKAVNFGIIYGQQAYGLSLELGIDVKEAGLFIERYFERFKRVKEFIEECKQTARLTGRATTLTGRERLIPEITSKNAQIRTAAERLSINTPLQGAAADLIKLAMLRVAKTMSEKQLRSLMILQIHDELLFEVPNEELELMQKLVKEEMQTVLELKVPLVVDIHVGKNWAEC